MGTDFAGAKATSHAFCARSASRLTPEGFELVEVTFVEFWFQSNVSAGAVSSRWRREIDLTVVERVGVKPGGS